MGGQGLLCDHTWWARGRGAVHRTASHLIESLVLASVDPFVESFDPGFFLLPTGCLEFDVTDLQKAGVGWTAALQWGSHLGLKKASQPRSQSLPQHSWSGAKHNSRSGTRASGQVRGQIQHRKGSPSMQLPEIWIRISLGPR